MRQWIITIKDNGTVSVPDKVMMRDFEIAELFGVMIPAIRSNIHTILKSGIAAGNFINGVTLVGCNFTPDYHGLDMVVALAFRIHSPQAKVFRTWILKKISQSERGITNQQIFISINKSRNRLIN